MYARPDYPPIAVILSLLLCVACNSSGGSGDGDGGDGDGDRDVAGDGDGDATGDGDGDGDGGDGDGDAAGDGDGDAPGDGDGDATGDGDADGDAPLEPSNVAEVCEAVADAMCALVESCGGGCASLRANLNIDERCAAAESFEQDGELSIVAGGTARCVAAIAARRCGQGGFRWFPECARLFEGTRPDGAQCHGSADGLLQVSHCQGYCDTTGMQCPGECKPYVGEGEGCAGTRCAGELVCTDATCSPQGGMGEACSSPWTCADGLVCAGAAGVPATCLEPAAEGAACAGDYACEWPLACDGGACAAVVASGAACRDRSNCPGEEDCLADSPNGATRSCQPRLGEGVACDWELDQCAEGLSCEGDVSPTCVAGFGALGEACGPWGCAEGLWCKSTAADAGECAVRGTEGQDCTDYHGNSGRGRCAEGLHCMADGNCHGPGDVGDPCQWDDELTCMAGRFCDRETGACQLARTDGQTCNPNYAWAGFACQDGLYCQCLSMFCPSYSDSHDPADVCAPRKANGATCTWPYECQSNYCDVTCGEPPLAACLPPDAPPLPQ